MNLSKFNELMNITYQSQFKTLNHQLQKLQSIDKLSKIINRNPIAYFKQRDATITLL